MKWISVKDEMPTAFTLVLTLCSIKWFDNQKSNVNVGFYTPEVKNREMNESWILMDVHRSQSFRKNTYKRFFDKDYPFDVITHWMPLPNQPERSKREDNE